MLAPGERPETSQQYLKRERFGQVIIGPGIETRHHILDGIAGGEQKNWGGDSRLPQLTNQRQAVQTGKHDIEHEQVKGAGLCDCETLWPIEGHSGPMTLLFQSFFQL